MSPQKEFIIFDANFFICMLSIRVKNVLRNLEKAGKELNLNYYMSQQVFDEVKAPHTFKNTLKRFVKIQNVSSSEVKSVKNELGKYNIRFPAQDPDLSLIIIGKRLLEEEENNPEVHLVTDDFKLAKNTNLLYKNKISILSLSSFLLKIHRMSSDKRLRNYFKNVWRKSLNYTLSYMIERSKQYPAEDKITWLIERAVAVTEDSIIHKDSYIMDRDQIQFGIGSSKYSEEITIAEKYISGKNLTQSEEEQVENIFKFLENLKIAREYLNRSRGAIIKNDSTEAVKFLKKGNGFLISLLQIGAGQLKTKKEYEIVEKLICSEISKMEFLRAFLLVSLARINSAIDSLERAALFSTIINNSATCLTLNYIKALIQLFHGFYKNAFLQFNFTEELSEIYKDPQLKLKCSIGKAIALFIQGNEEDKETAKNMMEEISSTNLEENIRDAIIVFSELGDYFLALGHPQLATSLYNESLEMTIDTEELDWKIELLVEKLKRSFIATVLNGYDAEEVIENLNVLLDKAYKVKNIDRYNEQIKKISSFNVQLYTPFPHISGKRKLIDYKDLPEGLKDDYLEVVHFKRLDKGMILFIVSHYELGLLGIKTETKENIVGIAENYSIKIKSNAKAKIYKPSEEIKSVYLIRAIIEIGDKDMVDINYTLPTFFKQLNI
ncbi:MAG: hypothetical protein BAJALOKI2v1_360025 [Promethearchaeota archaeon]|nr:MAG: hypothetical protein BAJALOKI2v1_360025 [Candidatus Lokiarchaeota archaeon]